MWKMTRDQPPDDCARFLPPGFTGSVACPVTLNKRGKPVRRVRDYVNGGCIASYNVRIRRPR